MESQAAAGVSEVGVMLSRWVGVYAAALLQSLRLNLKISSGFDVWLEEESET